eukprot:TRINITY_DN3371_c0_g1_i1.p1 TRINITY_DN3371_c0_g1~~TRINITY_DN3371_c0_g1_i1.p1  ORF type:complete len:843 (+),score=192.43 TRINITY_DN3371_c0_g1_i1:31-2529(+)
MTSFSSSSSSTTTTTTTLSLIFLTLIFGLSLAQSASPVICGGDFGSVTVTTISAEIDYVRAVDEDTVFLLTIDGTLYRSVDGGVNWDDLADKMENYTVTPSPVLRQQRPGARDFYLAKADNHTIFVLGNSGHLWYSENAGETFSFIRTGLEIERLLPHPTEKGWLMAHHWSPCCFTNTCEYGCVFDSSVSKDFGQTFTRLKHSLLRHSYPSWGLAGIDGRSKETIFMPYWPWPEYPRVVKTEDLFATETEVAADALQIIYNTDTNVLLIAVFLDDLELWVSTDEGSTISESRFPIDTHNDHIKSLLFLDFTEGALFVAVNRGQRGVSELFEGDLFGGDFTFIMNNTKVNSFNSLADFSPVHGTDGVYIINQNHPEISTTTFHTMISFDKGGEWEHLQPPADECIGLNSTECRLNLFGMVDGDMFNWESRATAPGVVVGLGSVGSTISYSRHNLEEMKDLSSIYVSDDAGKSWMNSLSGPTEFELAPYASFLAAMDSETDGSLHYSFDLGVSWQECIYDEEYYNYLTNSSAVPADDLFKYSIEDIFTGFYKVTPQTQHSRQWLWLETTGADRLQRLIHIDFNLELPDCEDDDYELFTPHDENGGCVLGLRSHYRRKKSLSMCVPADEKLVLVSSEPCACTREDYYCTYCFVEDQETRECVKDVFHDQCTHLFDPTPPPSDCPEGTTYEGGSAYRRVVGTECTTDLPGYLDPRVVDCPDATYVPPSPSTTSGEPPKVVGQDPFEESPSTFQTVVPMKNIRDHHVSTTVILGSISAGTVVIVSGIIALVYYFTKASARRQGDASDMDEVDTDIAMATNGFGDGDIDLSDSDSLSI